MSTNDFISIFLSIELQSYGCAPGEVDIAEILILSLISTLSDIFGPPIGGYPPRVITQSLANYVLCWIADHKRIRRIGLPLSEMLPSGDSHGQDNEFDTYRAAQLGLGVLSRISRHLKGSSMSLLVDHIAMIAKHPFAYFSLEDKRAQNPKTIINANARQPRDLTAYGYNIYLMRGRSFHSSFAAKGNSRKPSSPKVHDSNTEGAKKLNLGKGSNLITSVSSWAKHEVNLLLKGDGTYNGLIRILSNPLFLQACYLEIKSKPGNMSKGTDDTTLDGINIKWFEKTANDLLTGNFSFSPARRVMIPKPGKKEKRPLSVANPRDKIIQKALTVVLEAI